jgi:hypothetical protein
VSRVGPVVRPWAKRNPVVRPGIEVTEFWGWNPSGRCVSLPVLAPPQGGRETRPWPVAPVISDGEKRPLRVRCVFG